MSFNPSFRSLSSLVAVTCMISSQLAQAQTATCPLQGSKLADLRASAERLQQRISLGNGCEATEATVQTLGASVKTSIDQLYSIQAEQRKKDAEAKKNLTPEQLQEFNEKNAEKEEQAEIGRQKLKASVDAVDMLGQQLHAISDTRCGRELLTNLDYMAAFVETINGLTPSMLLFASASAAPAILAGSVITSLAKSVILFFRSGSKVNMNDPKQRKYYEETACAFYSFDRLYQGVQNRPAALEESNQKLVKLKDELTQLAQRPAPIAATEFALYIEAEKAHNEDQKALKDAEKLIADLGGSDSARCGLVRSLVSNKYSEKVITRFDLLLKENETKGQPAPLDRSVLDTYSALSKTENFQAVGTEDSIKRCGANASEWLKMSQYVLTRITAELNAPTRLEAAYREIRAYQKTIADKQGEIKREDEYNKWLQSSTQDRADSINLSEIVEAQLDAKEAMFASKVRRFLLLTANDKSPTEAWLDHKNKRAEQLMNIFRQEFKQVDSHWLNSTPTPAAKDQACGEAETVRLQWLDAAAHVDAMDVLCDTFKFHIQRTPYPQVHNYCVGQRYDRREQQWKSPRRSETRSLVEGEKPKAIKIDLWQRAVGCKRPI